MAFYGILAFLPNSRIGNQVRFFRFFPIFRLFLTSRFSDSTALVQTEPINNHHPSSMPGTPSITCVCFLTGTERYIVNATQPHNLHGTNVWTNKWKLQICSPFCQALPQPSMKGGGCFQWWSHGCVYFFQEKVFQYTCSPFCLHIWNSGGPVCTQHLEIQHKQYGKYGSSPHLWLLTIAGHSVCDCLGGSGGQILSGGGSPAAAHYDTIHPEPPWLHAANTNKRTNGAATPPFQCSRGDEQVLHRSQLVIRESNF